MSSSKGAYKSGITQPLAVQSGWSDIRELIPRTGAATTYHQGKPSVGADYVFSFCSCSARLSRARDSVCLLLVIAFYIVILIADAQHKASYSSAVQEFRKCLNATMVRKHINLLLIAPADADRAD